MKTSYICDNISLNYPQNKKNFRENLYRKHTNFVLSNFSPENRAICEIMRKILVEPDKPQVEACALHTG
jgi:hypothetical protein